MGSFIDITGNKYGRLTVVCMVSKKSKNMTRWLCECECGIFIKSNKGNLINGHTKSCGCYSREIITGNKYRQTHGQSRTRLYHIWQSMKQRCYDEHVKEFIRYGGRGIGICDTWKSEFIPFYEWAITNGYDDQLTIDRINNNSNYSPHNCRWVSTKDQNRNKTSSRMLEFDGKNECVGYWSELLNIPKTTILNRLNRGCSSSEALNQKYNGRYHQMKSNL